MRCGNAFLKLTDNGIFPNVTVGEFWEPRRGSRILVRGGPQQSFGSKGVLSLKVTPHCGFSLKNASKLHDFEKNPGDKGGFGPPGPP